jgi:hypothetical protein
MEDGMSFFDFGLGSGGAILDTDQLYSLALKAHAVDDVTGGPRLTYDLNSTICIVLYHVLTMICTSTAEMKHPWYVNWSLSRHRVSRYRWTMQPVAQFNPE